MMVKYSMYSWSLRTSPSLWDRVYSDDINEVIEAFQRETERTGKVIRSSLPSQEGLKSARTRVPKKSGD